MIYLTKSEKICPCKNVDFKTKDYDLSQKHPLIFFSRRLVHFCMLSCSERLHRNPTGTCIGVLKSLPTSPPKIITWVLFLFNLNMLHLIGDKSNTDLGCYFVAMPFLMLLPFRVYCCWSVVRATLRPCYQQDQPRDTIRPLDTIRHQVDDKTGTESSGRQRYKNLAFETHP